MVCYTRLSENYSQMSFHHNQTVIRIIIEASSLGKVGQFLGLLSFYHLHTLLHFSYILLIR